LRAAGGDEEPGQAWVDVSAAGAGLSVLNDAKYGHDVRGGDIGVTAVRSPVYACHEPKELEPDGVYEWMDQGRQAFTLRLVPHAGDWRDAAVVRLAAELNQPAFPLLESFHDGPLPLRASHASDGAGDVVVSVLKAAEDGDGSLVVRAYESAGRAAHASIELPLVGRSVGADFGPGEIKTFRVPRDADQPPTETSLLEW
jgi:alpha-mannosidase